MGGAALSTGWHQNQKNKKFLTGALNKKWRIPASTSGDWLLTQIVYKAFLCSLVFICILDLKKKKTQISKMLNSLLMESVHKRKTEQHCKTNVSFSCEDSAMSQASPAMKESEKTKHYMSITFQTMFLFFIKRK